MCTAKLVGSWLKSLLNRQRSDGPLVPGPADRGGREGRAERFDE